MQHPVTSVQLEQSLYGKVMVAFFVDDGPAKKSWCRWSFCMLSPRDLEAIATWSRDNNFPLSMSIVPRYRGARVTKFFSNPRYRQAFELWKAAGLGITTEILTHGRLWDIDRDRFSREKTTEKDLYTAAQFSSEYLYRYIRWGVEALREINAYATGFTNPWTGVPSEHCAQAVLRLCEEGFYGIDASVPERAVPWFNMVRPDDYPGQPRLLSERGDRAVYALDSASRDIADLDHADTIIRGDGTGKFDRFLAAGKRYFVFHSHLWQGIFPEGKGFIKLQQVVDRLRYYYGEKTIVVSPQDMVAYYHQFRNTVVRMAENGFFLEAAGSPSCKITVKIESARTLAVRLPTGELVRSMYSDGVSQYFSLLILDGLYQYV